MPDLFTDTSAPVCTGPRTLDNLSAWMRKMVEWSGSAEGREALRVRRLMLEEEEREQMEPVLAERQRRRIERAAKFAADHCPGASFSTWRHDTPEQRAILNQLQALSACLTGHRKWNIKVPQGLNFVCLAGPVGVGKTHLCVSLARDLIERADWTAASWPIATFLRAANPFSYPDPEIHRAAAVIEEAKRVQCLILDDLGSKSSGLTNTQLTALFSVIDHRTTHNLLTVGTSNLGRLWQMISARRDADATDVERLLSRLGHRAHVFNVGAEWIEGDGWGPRSIQDQRRRK